MKRSSSVDVGVVSREMLRQGWASWREGGPWFEVSNAGGGLRKDRVLVVSGTIVSPPLVRKHLAPGRQEPTPE